MNGHFLLYLTLAERLDGGGIVQLLRPDHRLHVEDLAAHALHQHREEVWVAEVQGALRERKVNNELSDTLEVSQRKHVLQQYCTAG